MKQENAEGRLLCHLATGFLDGVAVGLRENGRIPGQRSGPVMQKGAERARRVLVGIEPRRDAREAWDFPAATLACAVDIAGNSGMAEGWDDIAPGG